MQSKKIEQQVLHQEIALDSYLKTLLDELGMDPRSLMRTFEAPYKENNLDDESLSEDQLVQAMVDNPILIERPIVKTDKGIAIGRPPENILAIL